MFSPSIKFIPPLYQRLYHDLFFRFPECLKSAFHGPAALRLAPCPWRLGMVTVFSRRRKEGGAGPRGDDGYCFDYFLL